MIHRTYEGGKSCIQNCFRHKFQRQYLADVQMDINQTLNTPPLLLDIPCTAVLDLAQDEQIYWQFVKIWKISTPPQDFLCRKFSAKSLENSQFKFI